MDEVELTLSLLRKKYKGEKIDLNKLSACDYWFSKESLELEIEFSHLCKWSGEELAYDVTINLNSDFTIKRIGALHCRRYTGADATSAGYRGKRADEIDYMRLENKLLAVIQKD